MTIFLGSKIISAKITAFITSALCKYTMTLKEALKRQANLRNLTGTKRVSPAIKRYDSSNYEKG